MIDRRTSFDWCEFRGLVHIAKYRTLVKSALGALMTGVLCVSATWAATSENANSPLGINLEQVSYFSAELPFLDHFKTNSGFSTQTSSGSGTNEESYLNLDADGWPVTLTAVNNPSPQKFTQVSVLLLRNLPNTQNGPYPAGKYVVRYQGEGEIAYGYDAAKISSAPGRDVIEVSNPSYGGGVLITIRATDPKHTGNYIRNIQFVKAEQESALIAGQIFNPTFLKLMQNFRSLRFVDWFNTNGNTLSSWSDRPQITDATWASSKGVPYEVAVKLANALSADPWLNEPVKADDNYITQLATLVHNQLGSTQKVYVEFSNEVWNSGFSQHAYANAQGRAIWPHAGSEADYGNNWYGMRVAQSCDIWKSVWGSDSPRVVCVMGAQAANPWTATEALSCKLWSEAPCSNHGIGAVAIAPYFGGRVPGEWTSHSDGGLNSLLESLATQNHPSVPAGGWLGQALGWVAAYPSAIAKYKLPLIAYEGGQTFVSFPNGAANGVNTPLTNLFIAANRDPRMKAMYQNFLQGWKTHGGQLFVYYNDVFPPSQYGLWGALESTMQATTPLSSAPPKWQALQDFIKTNPCWWSGCTGSLAATPMPPSNVKVQ
jgi:hypothetical protein